MSGATTGASEVADAGLNVVPFIDLLICLICFLVVSAAWTSLSRIDVDQALPKRGHKPAVALDKPPLLQVAITSDGFAVNVVEGPKALATPAVVRTLGAADVCLDGKQDCARTERYRRYDHAGLRAALERLMATKGVGGGARILVAADDEVPYLHMIATLDSVLNSCIGEGAGRRCLSNPSIGDMGLLRR